MCSDITDLINMFSTNNQYHLSNIHEGLGIVQKTLAYIILFDLFNNPGKQAQLPEFPTQGWGKWGKRPHTNQDWYKRKSDWNLGSTWLGSLCVCVSVCISMCMCMHTRVCVCMCTHLCVRTHLYVCTHMCVCVEARGKPVVSFTSCATLNKNAPYRLTYLNACFVAGGTV